MFIPTQATLLRSVKEDHFISLMGLTVSLIYKHLAKSIATSMGYLRHQEKDIKTTKRIESTTTTEESIDLSPSQELSNRRTNTMYSIISSTSDIRRKIPIRQENSLYSLPEVITTCLSSATMI